MPMGTTFEDSENVDRSFTYKRDNWIQRCGFLDNLPAEFPRDYQHFVEPAKRNSVHEQHIIRATKNFLTSTQALINKTPSIYRRQLVSPRKEVHEAQPFRLPQADKTLENYTSQWVSFLLFLVRAAKDNYIFNLPEDACNALDTLAKDQDLHVDDMPPLIFKVSVATLHVFFRTEANCPIYSYLCLTFYNRTKDFWEEPGTCTSKLAGMLFCARLIILAEGWGGPQCEGNDTEAFINNFPWCRLAILEDSPHPMGEIISLLAYGLKKQPDKVPDLFWSPKMDYFHFHDDRFCIKTFKELVQTVLQESELILTQLTFGDYNDVNIFEALEPSPEFMSKIKETPPEIINNYSFISDHRNKTLFSGLDTVLLRTILTVPNLREKYALKNGSSGGWKLEPTKAWVERAHEFLDNLLLLVHLTNGQQHTVRKSPTFTSTILHKPVAIFML
ncbi:hypothetical protein BGX38DRAFT_1279111 [Terfezia claveryi]|nr:hypothetical protein BGX38DRAFT_1279111 [Terfezia claveryi]